MLVEQELWHTFHIIFQVAEGSCHNKPVHNSQWQPVGYQLCMEIQPQWHVFCTCQSSTKAPSLRGVWHAWKGRMLMGPACKATAKRVLLWRHHQMKYLCLGLQQHFTGQREAEPTPGYPSCGEAQQPVGFLVFVSCIIPICSS